MPGTRVKKRILDMNQYPPPPPGEKTLGEGQMVQTQELHCQNCGRFLCYQAIVWGIIKIKCPNSKCKEWNTIDISPEHKL